MVLLLKEVDSRGLITLSNPFSNLASGKLVLQRKYPCKKADPRYSI